mmetsp:Transcript_11636/g.35985  ORF Transcript_11636/g.35985 Transcript_11636/m.35985 type:complete len:289 (-) Transcript_11636:6-872(-)
MHALFLAPVVDFPAAHLELLVTSGGHEPLDDVPAFHVRHCLRSLRLDERQCVGHCPSDHKGKVAERGQRGTVDARRAVHVCHVILIRQVAQHAHRLGQHERLIALVKITLRHAHHHHAALKGVRAQRFPVDAQRLKASVRLQAHDGRHAGLVHQRVHVLHRARARAHKDVLGDAVPIECPGPFARVVVAPRLCCPPGPVLALRVRRPTSQRRRRRAHSAPPRACLCPPRRALEPRCRACTSCAAGAAARQDEAVRRPRVRARSHCHRRSCATEYARNLLRNCAHTLIV